jgi:hypothetical protein
MAPADVPDNLAFAQHPANLRAAVVSEVSEPVQRLLHEGDSVRLAPFDGQRP